MAIYTTNQARHMYVMKAYNDPLANEGDLKVNETPDKKSIYFTTIGKGGNLRSDLIDKDKIMYAKYTDYNKYRIFLKDTTILLNPAYPTIEANQDYLLRIKISNHLTMATEPSIYQYGIVHTYSGMTDSDFYKKMALSLAKNLARTDVPMLKVYLGGTEVTQYTSEASLTGTYPNIVLKEVEQPWVLGKFSQKPLNYNVWCSTVTSSSTGDEYVWGDITYPISSTYLTNGKRIADMEYFYIGERGDIYRDNVARVALDTEYMADPTKEYSTLDIHYYYVGSNEGSQKSEKDIMIVSSEPSAFTSLLAELTTTLGITVEGIPA